MELEFYFPKTKSKHKCVPTTGKVYPSKGGTIRYGVQATMNGSKSLPKYITEQEFNRLGFDAESFEADMTKVKIITKDGKEKIVEIPAQIPHPFDNATIHTKNVKDNQLKGYVQDWIRDNHNLDFYDFNIMGAESFEASVDLGEKRISSRKDYDIDNDYEYEDLEIGDVDLMDYENDLDSNLEDEIKDAIRESVDDNLPLSDGETGSGYVDVDTEIDITVPVSGQVKYDWTSNENHHDENTDDEWYAETFDAEQKMSKSTTFKGKWEIDTTRKIDGVNVTKVLWNKYVVEYKGYLGTLEDANIGEGYWRIRFYGGNKDYLSSWAGDFDGDWDWFWKKYGKNESSRYYYTSKTTYSKEIALDDFKTIVDKFENGDELTRNVFASNDEYLREKEQVAGLDKEERYELYDENKLECDECGAVNKTVGYVEEGYKLCQPCDREMMAKQGYDAEMASLSEIVFEDNVGKKYTTHSDYDHSLINDMVSDEDLVPMDAETVGNPSPSSPLEEVPATVPSPAEPTNENFEAQIGYDGAKSYAKAIDSKFEGANDEGFFPADEEDFKDMVVEEIEEHIDFEDWNEEYNAESKNTKMVLGITALGIGLAFWKGKDLLSLWDRIKEKMD